LANILQRLADEAKKKKDELVQHIAGAGAAPTPVQINTPDVVSAIQHAKYGRFANNPAAATNFLHTNAVIQQQNRPSLTNGLSNLGDAQDKAVMKTIVQPFITRPAAEISQTARQFITKKPSTYTPGSPMQKELFGNEPVASIQKKVSDQYQRQSTSGSAALRLASRPLAAAEGAVSVANDLPVIGGVTKGLIKGTAKAAPTVAKVAENVIPKAAPVIRQVGKSAQEAGQVLDRGVVATTKAVSGNVKAANAKKSNVANYDATIADLYKQKSALQQRIRNTTNFRGVETTQRHIDQIDADIAQVTASKPKMTLKDKILAPNVGLGMKAVHSPDLTPEQNQFIETYADMLKEQGQGNGVTIHPDGRRLSNNYRAPGMGSDRKTNAHWFDQARNELESGKGAYGASDEYKALHQAEAPLEIPAGFEAPTAPPTTPAIQSPDAAVPVQPPVSRETGAVSSPNISTKDYLRQQAQAQEVARKAGQPQGIRKLTAPLADTKSKLIDSLSPIEDTLNQRITKDNATGHITPQLDRALRADTIAGQYIKDKGLADVIQSVPNTKEFDQYLIAKHAADLEKNGIKTGRNAASDAQLVNDLAAKYEPHAQALKQYSQGLLDQAVNYGLISKKLAGSLKEKYPNYVPANRIFGADELVKPPKGIGGGKASLGSQSVVQKIKGSDRQIESPLSSLIDKTHAVIDQGERNKAAQILTGYKDLQGNPFQLRRLRPDEAVGSKHVISVLVDGKPQRYETTPEIANAAKSLSKEQLGLIGRIFAVPTRILRLGATGLNPAFAGANAIKDLASGALNSKNPLRSSVANPSVFLQALKVSLNHGSKEYGELVREGAGGTSFDIARNAPKQNVANIRAQKNAASSVAYTVTHPAQLLRAAENTVGRSEEFSRALQYYGGKQAAKASGAGDEAARVLGAHAARNNTVNFSRAGDYGRVLNSVLPYLNAGIQGSRTLVRNAGERPVQTATKLVILGFMPTAATTAWNLATPDRKAAYDDIKPYEKQGNLIIVPPNPKKDPATGKWNVIKIPVSQEIANLNNIVRNGIETGLHNGTFDKGRTLGDLIGTTTSIQAENGRQLIGQATPQAIKPFAENVFNQNFFTGNKIVPDSQKNLDARDQYGSNTSGTAKVVGRNLNVSPRQIDNTLSTAGGGLSKNLINVSDKLLAASGTIKPDEVKGTPFSTSIQSRFKGAQGSNQYDAIDSKTADLTKQLKQLPGYKSMSPAEKSKALSRLTNQITQTYTSDKALTAKQQAIDNGSVNVSDYLTPSTGNKTPISTKIDKTFQQTLTKYNAMNDDQRKQAQYSQNDFDFKYAQAKYNNDIANNKLSKTAVIKAQDALAKDRIGSKYSKDVRDLYTLTKSDLYDFLTSDPNGQTYADQLKAYDNSLKDSGIISTAKFKNGFNTSTGANGSGKSLSTLLAEFKLPGADDLKNRSKAASLARNAHLAKKS
jgi:hypothetical protein